MMQYGEANEMEPVDIRIFDYFNIENYMGNLTYPLQLYFVSKIYL